MEQAQAQTKASKPAVPARRQMIRNRVAFLENRTPAYASALGIVGIVLMWEALCRTGVVPALFLPSPSAIVTVGWGMLMTGEILENVLASLFRIAAGYALGSFAGIVIGLLLGFFRWVDSVLTPVVYSIYPIPKIALLPLFILWLGIGEMPS